MHETSSYTVLIVEDDPGFAVLLGKKLRRAGFCFEIAATGNQALQRLKGQKPDLILLDLKLEDMDGKQFAGQLEESQIEVPYMVVTGNADLRIAVEMMRQGAQDYLVKDSSLLESVVHRVEQVIRRFERERRLSRAEEVVREREGLAALGEMAATVAHEIKNPLAAIYGALQILRDQAGIQDPNRPILQELVDRVELLNQRVQRVLRFSKPTSLARQVVNLMEAVEEVVASAKREAAFDQVEVGIEGESNIPAALDLLLFEDMLRNLLYNSAEAMPKGGKIRIHLSIDSTAAVLRLRDNGAGMAEETLQRVFRPLFTTKSRGTGLGLPFCKRIIEAHGGSIEIKSRLGQGTEVVLLVPATDCPNDS